MGREDAVQPRTGVLPKENGIRPPAASWVGSEITTPSEASHRETSVSYLWSLKNDANAPIYKQKQTYCIEYNLKVPKGEAGEGQISLG